jgi:hypothetical protein
MSDNFSAPGSLPPLSLGNVVTAGFRLYRSHLKSYFSLAVIACLWTLVPVLFFIPAGILIYLSVSNGSVPPLPWVLLVIIGIVSYFYCLGKYLVNAAIISRLGFSELVNQPETVTAARGYVLPKLWSFVLTIFLLGLIFSGVFIGFMILMVIPLVNIVIFLPAVAGFLWIVARFFIADVLLAIEENLDAGTTISRSWELSKGNGWRIVLILFVALLITLPLQLIIQIFSQVVLQAVLQPLSSSPNNATLNYLSTIGIVYLLLLGLGVLVNACLLPFWQAIKAVIYYDLRTRREGLGLELREREM